MKLIYAGIITFGAWKFHSHQPSGPMGFCVWLWFFLFFAQKIIED